MIEYYGRLRNDGLRRADLSATFTLEMYSRGRRGAPAKGVGRLYRRESSNLSFSAKDTERPHGRSVSFLLRSGGLNSSAVCEAKGVGERRKNG